jgi:hypothetical protein
MVIYAAEGCGVIFRSDLLKRDIVAKRHGRLRMESTASPRFQHSRTGFTSDFFSKLAFAEQQDLNSFMIRVRPSPNVRISALKTVRLANKEAIYRERIEDGLNFTMKSGDSFADEWTTSRSNLDSKCKTIPENSLAKKLIARIVPRGSTAQDRRELAFIANTNALMKPYKEQQASVFFNDGSSPCSLSASSLWTKRHGASMSLQLPDRSFEECPEVWHVYAVQCFLSGDKVCLSPCEHHASLIFVEKMIFSLYKFEFLVCRTVPLLH